MPRVRHFDEKAVAFHVTTRTANGAFYMASVAEKQALLLALDFYRRRGDCALYGYVIMANHVHIVVRPGPNSGLPRFVDGFKTWTSRHNTAKPAGTSLWERRYDDNAISTLAELRDVLQYIHNNPVRAKIVATAQEYAWSSIHNYLADGQSMIEIDTAWTQ